MYLVIPQAIDGSEYGADRVPTKREALLVAKELRDEGEVEAVYVWNVAPDADGLLERIADDPVWFWRSERHIEYGRR
jgi:hypothetical protein